MTMDNNRFPRINVETECYCVWFEQHPFPGVFGGAIHMNARFYEKQQFGVIDIYFIPGPRQGGYQRLALYPVMDDDYRVTITRAQEIWRDELPAFITMATSKENQS